MITVAKPPPPVRRLLRQPTDAWKVSLRRYVSQALVTLGAL